MRVASLAVMLIALAGCASTAPSTPQTAATPARAPGPPPPTVNGAWTLVNFRDAAANETVGATLRLDGATAKGQISCREFSAATRQFGMDMRFENVTPASNDCAATPIETKFLQALSDVRGVTIRSGYLVLSDATGRERLYFKRA